MEIEDEVARLLKEKYVRCPQEDLETPDGKVKAYRKRVISQFTKVDNQGDLFNGFDTKPKCTINWSSSQQVIKLFELLGIKVRPLLSGISGRRLRNRSGTSRRISGPAGRGQETYPRYLHLRYLE